MSWLDFLDPDAIVKGIDGIEQALGKAVDNLGEIAEKVENTAGIVEKKASHNEGEDSTVDKDWLRSSTLYF